MNEILLRATGELAQFLARALADISADWWHKLVLDRLTFQQQRVAQERGFSTLEQLDLSALLRVFDQNWYELSAHCGLNRECRSWIKELQNVRNKWAHISAQAMPQSEIYRDADTLGRLLVSIGASQESLQAVESVKADTLANMAKAVSSQNTGAGNEERTGVSPDSGAITGTVAVDISSQEVAMFKVGELVALRSDPNIRLPIIEVLTGGAERRYRVFQNNAKAVYYESQLQSVTVPPAERTVPSISEMQAHLTSLQILAPSTASLFSLRSGRIRFVPYQYRPVLKLIRADRPRLLIADEVGVGKTIEAGLIIKELRARMDISSILVICPKALVAERKWFNEMKRFDEGFATLDGPMLRHCLRETHLEGEWPEQYAKAILPFSLFDSDLLFGRGGRSQDRGLLALDPPPKFDLVIVDEAHHIRNSETFLHQAVVYFCDNAQAVVLLTATPVQLGSDDLFTLLKALRPDLVIDHASFEQMAEPNPFINEAVRHCRKGLPDWPQNARSSLEQAAQTEWGRTFVRELPSFQNIFDRLNTDGLTDADRVELTRAIEELYTFSPMINRTRRRDIGEFTVRKAETLSVEFTPDQKRLHDDLLDIIARILERFHGQQNVKFLMSTIRRQAASCLYGLEPMLTDILNRKLDLIESMEATDEDADLDLGFVDQIRGDIQNLLEHARTLDHNDPKVNTFVNVLVDNDSRPKNKALVFSTFRHTLTYLQNNAQRTGLRVGLVHGDVPEEERAELRRRFALPKGDVDAIDVLLSSEVGCEGLDFQFCDFLINYDLPWNPMRIEQRIGRIDRYGQQSESVAIKNFITPGTVDAEIYDRCLWRIGVFQHAIGGNEEILGAITRELHDIAESFTLNAEDRANQLRQIADNRIRQLREEEELESKQSELFGLQVPNQAWRKDIEAADSFWLSPGALQNVVTIYLSQRLDSGLEHILGDKPVKTLRLSHEARSLLLVDYRKLPRSTESVAREWEKWLKGDQPTLSVTFDQQAAAENPKAVHLTVVHPLIRQAARYLENPEPAFFRMDGKNNEIAHGIHHFAVYRWVKRGVKSDELLVPVAENPQLEQCLLSLIQMVTVQGQAPLPGEAACDALDVRHHAKWIEAQANHIAENRQLVEHRVHSLTVSHRARRKAIEDQIARATNDKIRLMKQSELARAEADFNLRIAELQKMANTGDIQATPIVFGSVSITKDGD